MRPQMHPSGVGRAPEGEEMYASRCSLPALMEMLDDEGCGPEYVACVANSAASRVFEPAAFVVCNALLASLASRTSEGVRIRPGSALPLAYGRSFEGGTGDGR